MTTYYKATTLAGHDFRTGTVDYGSALISGSEVKHPIYTVPMIHDDPSTYLSISVEQAETLIGGAWPCRLFVVEPVGEVLDNLSASEYKRACLSLRVVEELPAHLALGPNGARVAALIERGKSITYAEAKRMDAAWDAAWDAARDAAWDAARGAALAERDAALAELVRDLITDAQYRKLAGPWNSVVGEIQLPEVVGVS
jgi:hypothetical protein